MTNIESLLAEPAPKMGDVPNTSVKLIRGVQMGDNWVNNAVVREMTGDDEEFLSSLEAKNNSNYGDYVLNLLKRTVVSIGDINVATTPMVLNDLLVGDRDLLFIAVIRATYGRNREFKVVCPHCNRSNDLMIDLESDFPVEGDVTKVFKPLEVILRNGSKLELNHPTAGDSAAVGRSNKNIAQQNTAMIARCARVEVPNKEEWARSLSVADRSTIVNAVYAAKVGPTPREVNAPCAHCAEEITLMFDWVSLLFG